MLKRQLLPVLAKTKSGWRTTRKWTHLWHGLAGIHLISASVKGTHRVDRVQYPPVTNQVRKSLT